jgi:hypothetical protein
MAGEDIFSPFHESLTLISINNILLYHKNYQFFHGNNFSEFEKTRFTLYL